MAKKNKTRTLEECRNVGEFIACLKKNFDPKDDIAIVVLMTIEKEAKIDVANNRTLDGTSHISNIGYSLKQIEDFRKEREDKENQD